MAGAAHELVQSEATLHATSQVPPVEVAGPVLPPVTTVLELESSPNPPPPQATTKLQAASKDPISTRFFAIRMVDLSLSSPGGRVSRNPSRSAIETAKHGLPSAHSENVRPNACHAACRTLVFHVGGGG
jgi:hypothetical protein